MIAGYVDQLLDGLTGNTIDLVFEFAGMLPILVICDMLDVPTDERHEFVAIGRAITRVADAGIQSMYATLHTRGCETPSRHSSTSAARIRATI